MYPEGLARLVTQKYKSPSKKNYQNLFMHLTNYAVNKKNPNFIYNESETDDNIGNKRSMTSVLKVINLSIKKLGTRPEFRVPNMKFMDSLSLELKFFFFEPRNF